MKHIKIELIRLALECSENPNSAAFRRGVGTGLILSLNTDRWLSESDYLKANSQFIQLEKKVSTHITPENIIEAQDDRFKGLATDLYDIFKI